MKKIILHLVLLSSLFAFQYDAKVYMGVGGGYQIESFSQDLEETQKQEDPLVSSFKIGYGDRRAYSIEFIVNYAMVDQSVFSDKDENKLGLDIAFVKAFNMSKYFYPYVRAGFGGGEMKIKNQDNSKLGFSSYNVGVGGYIPVGKHFEFEMNYEYRYTSYEEIELNEENYKSHINQIYFGFNTRF